MSPRSRAAIEHLKCLPDGLPFSAAAHGRPDIFGLAQSFISEALRENTARPILRRFVEIVATLPEMPVIHRAPFEDLMPRRGPSGATFLDRVFTRCRPLTACDLAKLAGTSAEEIMRWHREPMTIPREVLAFLAAFAAHSRVYGPPRGATLSILCARD